MGFIVSTLPLIDVVMGMDFPLLFFSTIVPVPFFIDSLKVTVMVLLTETFVA